MVKRQTVWLSTMMVLSLMLIGYYTMNNQTSTASTSPSGATVSTSVSNLSDSSSGSTSHSKTTNTSSQSNSSTPTQTTNATASDWFTTQRTTVDQQMSQQIDRLKAEMANSSSSSDQIAQASKELGTLESLDAGLGNAAQAIESDGFKNAVIVPDAKQTNFKVYVEANSLQKSDVVKIMNIVSQQLDVSMLNVSVNQHA